MLCASLKVRGLFTYLDSTQFQPGGTFFQNSCEWETGRKIVRQQLLMHISITYLYAFCHWHGRELRIRSFRSVWGLQYCLLVLVLITDENLQQWFSLYFFLISNVMLCHFLVFWFRSFRKIFCLFYFLFPSPLRKQ